MGGQIGAIALIAPFKTRLGLFWPSCLHWGIEHLDIVGHDTEGQWALILAIEHPSIVNRLVITNSVCYDRFDDDMLDFGHPTRWNDRSIDDLVDALDESLAAGLSNPHRLTPSFRNGILPLGPVKKGS